MANVSSSNGLEKRPKLRFPGFDDPWKAEKLSDFAERVTRKNTNNETSLPLTISSKDGLVDQISYFNKTVASKDMSGYYLLKNGEYAYNKSYSVGYDFGSVKRLDRYDMGALSTLYICFALKKHDSDFIKAYFDSLKWYREIYMISAEGARNHGLLNVPTDEFFDTKHYIPQDLAEQRKIANFMIALERRIVAQQSLVDNLKKYKRGLSKAVFSTNSELFPKSTVASLGELFPFIRNGFVGTVTPFFTSQENGVRYLQGTNIHDGKISDETAFYVTQAFNQKHSKNILKSNDILVVQSGHVGECAVVGDNYAGSNCHALIIMSNGGECASDYICQYINSDDGKKKIAAITTGNTIKHILATSIANIEVPLPSKKDQQRIAELLNSWDNRIEQEIRNLCKLVRIKEGLLQQLFI
ncbi:restriction endonuclease subunit S [Faecousia sp. CLA-AA-H192]|uniref:Restriction endonuclease subunit S n=2 Tax=Oscillospiraceae TaxID=216572 RepID=A0ABV1G8S6_9FIRM